MRLFWPAPQDRMRSAGLPPIECLTPADARQRSGLLKPEYGHGPPMQDESEHVTRNDRESNGGGTLADKLTA